MVEELKNIDGYTERFGECGEGFTGIGNSTGSFLPKDGGGATRLYNNLCGGVHKKLLW